jgi:acetyl esterase/lipase
MTERIAYGEGSLQFGDLTVPPGEGPFPVVVFIHGGFWRNAFGLDLAEPQAASASAKGFATWNVEYRRVGDAGGGYPGTLADVAAAIDGLGSLADDHPLDLGRVAVVGHSAGGHLALWVGQREQLDAGAVGADPAVVPMLVVGQAPVADLAGNVDLGGGAVEAFMGVTPVDDPAAYDIADPARLLPVVVPQLLVQGGDDRIVPPDRAEAYVALADSSDVELQTVAGADHFDVIDPDHESWTIVLDRLTLLWN